MIYFNDLKSRYKKYEDEIDAVVKRVLKSGWYILGRELEGFEESFSKYIGTKYCVGVNSGTDALFLALKALGVGEGDEVITVANTAVPTITAIRMTGAIPVFVEIEIDSMNIDPFKIESKISEKTKVILPVHLYGRAVDMGEVMKIARKYNLKVVEDVAQACGSSFEGKKLGSIGDVGCFSFYPTKNLGAFGDGGAMCVNDNIIYEKMRGLRNYGEVSKYNNKIEGVNSRLDEMQAALLSWGLERLDNWNARKQELVDVYVDNLNDLPVVLPLQSDEKFGVAWHLFVIRVRDRDGLKKYLDECSVQTVIHYPRPIFEQEAYDFLVIDKNDLGNTRKAMNDILSLPLYPEMKEEEVVAVCKRIREYYEK